MKIPSWVFKVPWDAVRHNAEEFKYPLLIAAFIKAESNCNTNAMRFEPKWRYHWNVQHWAKEIGSSLPTEENGQATSWGAMQVMGTTAREMGFQDWFTALCNPMTGIHYGCKFLKKKIEVYSKLEDAIASYNSGSPRFTEGGFYMNEDYVNSVLKHYRELKTF
jgi:soluble lytic murein transglycosylase-like protein